MCPTMGHLSCWCRPRTGPTNWKPDSVNRTRSRNVPVPRRGGGVRSGAGDLGFLDEDLAGLRVGPRLGLGGVAEVCQLGDVALGVEGGGAAGAGCGDGLAVVVVDEI